MNELGRLNLPFLFIIDFYGKTGIVKELKDISSSEILYDVDGISNYKPQPKKTIEVAKFPMDIDSYGGLFNQISYQLHYGNSYLANLTCKTKIELNCDLKDVFFGSTAQYKLYLKDNFVCFSPECFIKIFGNKIFTYPMKGTISSLIPNALEVILNDQKEKAEHNTIVDLLRNDLAIISENVTVSKFRFPTYVKTKDYNLIQISSEIIGELEADFNSHIGDILQKLLPAGSVTGAPKQKTVDIIKSTENYNRGFYTGIFGIYDGNNLDSAVAIRFIQKEGDEYYFKSGGGITINSNLEAEYQEMIDKIYVPID